MEWTEEQQAVLVHWAELVVRRFPPHFIAIDDLVNATWVRLFSDGRIDARHASRGIIIKVMFELAQDMYDGRSRYARAHTPVSLTSLDAADDNRPRPQPAAVDWRLAAIDDMDDLAGLADSRLRRLADIVSRDHPLAIACHWLRLDRNSAARRLRRHFLPVRLGL